jgi:inorganic triphosphatase YgiF
MKQEDFDEVVAEMNENIVRKKQLVKSKLVLARETAKELDNQYPRLGLADDLLRYTNEWMKEKSECETYRGAVNIVLQTIRDRYNLNMTLLD